MKVLAIILLALSFPSYVYAQDDLTPCGEFSIRTSETAVATGNSVIFEVYRESKPIEGFSYEWTTSAGLIVKGQGTSKIQVETLLHQDDLALIATVTVKQKGGTCQSNASASVTLQEVVRIFDPERHGKLNNWKMQVVIDNLFIRLNDNPGWVGVIVIDYEASETRKQKLNRIRMIQRAIAYLKHDPSRISIAIAREPSSHTYTLLPGEKIFPLSESDYKIYGLTELVKNPDLALPSNKNKLSK